KRVGNSAIFFCFDETPSACCVVVCARTSRRLVGSIRREMYMAEQTAGSAVEQTANRTAAAVPVLISAGSQDPCIRLLFEQAQADLAQVWLEKCAGSTFENFVYSLPVLEKWGVHTIKLVTSGSHGPRALWMGRIMLGAHRIWVIPELVEETGIPGNEENALKTGLDVGRSLGWALVSQVYHPRCGRVVPLTAVDLDQWRQRGFKCEHQAGIEGS
ncbi:MAG: ElyC/SanA/YdcF family protein, partial [Cyanobacteria bacterium P01_A01_bin.114]